MKKRLAVIGLTSALAFSGAACGGEKGPDSENPGIMVHVIEGRDVQLYREAFVHGNRLSLKAGSLKAGSEVLALCFQDTKDPELSSIHVKSKDADGYAEVNSFEGSNDKTPTPVFDLSAQQLQDQLPDC